MNLINIETIKGLWEDEEVANLFNELGYSEDDDDFEELKNELEAIYNYGCVSGCCPALTYYRDTTAFFERNEDRVAEHIALLAQEVGLDSICQNLDYDDVIKCTEYAKNAYVWSYVESVVSRIIENY